MKSSDLSHSQNSKGTAGDKVVGEFTEGIVLFGHSNRSLSMFPVIFDDGASFFPAHFLAALVQFISLKRLFSRDDHFGCRNIDSSFT